MDEKRFKEICDRYEKRSYSEINEGFAIISAVKELIVEVKRLYDLIPAEPFTEAGTVELNKPKRKNK